MKLLQRASAWRELFAGDRLPDPTAWPPVLSPLQQALTALGAEPDLAHVHAWRLSLVDALDRLDLPAWRISQLVSDLNDWLYRRAITLSLEEMRSRGWGEPPVAFCVLTLGSAARHESLLGPDQDNAMIIADYPDARHVEIDGYFQALGERFTARLADAGIPLCPGHVMARWPMWRKRLGEWDAQLAIWTAERRVKRVQQANILLDFQPVYGDKTLAETLRDRVVALMPRAHLFLDEMEALLNELPVALDRLGRLRSGDAAAPHGRALDLKHGGVLPLVNAVRLLALRHGVRSSATRERLVALVLAEALTADQARTLTAALERLQALLLESQRRALAEGRAPDGWVDLDRLDEAQRLLLRHDLGIIRRLVREAKTQ
ncbi:DUF294 nucleotidyltransferase-like domain-containing protein [Halomonas cerina]|uniref:CBS domain-containing protein n=1 Tax=Halomonas cerina TaxID=447424 RepID=A0A839UZJ7_9GAMM|nr:DUF294 nucleotidyltransferase-like domain-containing protein [Halomonas cerina]MBB3188943.1 CBS domain-containing protein [Halomonas cerina]